MGVVLTSVIRGFKPMITIPDKMSNEKINRLKALGAEVLICPTEVNPYLPEGYKGRAKKIAEDYNGYFPN
jgi:cystathionine beta-synthase